MMIDIANFSWTIVPEDIDAKVIDDINLIRLPISIWNSKIPYVILYNGIYVIISSHGIIYDNIIEDTINSMIISLNRNIVAIKKNDIDRLILSVLSPSPNTIFLPDTLVNSLIQPYSPCNPLGLPCERTTHIAVITFINRHIHRHYDVCLYTYNGEYRYISRCPPPRKEGYICVYITQLSNNKYDISLIPNGSYDMVYHLWGSNIAIDRYSLSSVKIKLSRYSYIPYFWPKNRFTDIHILIS